MPPLRGHCPALVLAPSSSHLEKAFKCSLFASSIPNGTHFLKYWLDKVLSFLKLPQWCPIVHEWSRNFLVGSYGSVSPLLPWPCLPPSLGLRDPHKRWLRSDAAGAQPPLPAGGHLPACSHSFSVLAWEASFHPFPRWTLTWYNFCESVNPTALLLCICILCSFVRSSSRAILSLFLWPWHPKYSVLNNYLLKR